MRLSPVLFSPLVLLAAAILICTALLARPLSMPLGPMYWDLVLYLDAANRIGDGQVPVIDFFTPVGPLGYWLFAGLAKLFPSGHPLLIAQWSTLIVTAPAMALILRHLDRRSRPLALGLLLPYLVFQLLPINVEHFSYFPGTDGFGIYNRQISIVLYVLVAGLVFLRDRRLLAALLIWTLLAALAIKITGFVAGGFVAAFALAAGRLGWRMALAAGLSALALLGALELGTGIVSAYLDSIAALVAINAGAILPRFLQAASLHLDIVGAGAALVIALAWFERRELAHRVRAVHRERSPAAASHLLDHPLFWLIVTMAAGLFFETQNTGGQAFIFVWPVLLQLLATALKDGGRRGLALGALIAAMAIPPAETVLQRMGRTLLAQTTYVALPHTHLGMLGRVSQNREVMLNAETMMAIYPRHPKTFEDIAAANILPNSSLYSALDFQAGWLLAIDAGISAILAHEQQTGRRFGTILSLNFANPFPYLMGRSGVQHVAIGADPFRAVPAMDAQTQGEVEAADLILYPRCPVTVANARLRDIYTPAMQGRREIALGPCWTGYVKP